MNKLTADGTRGMLATFRFSVLRLAIAIQNINTEICIAIILPVVLYRCWTLSLTLREEQRLRVFENKVLRYIWAFERQGNRGGGEDCQMKSFMICTSHQLLFRWLNPEKLDGRGKWDVWGERKKFIKGFGGKTYGKHRLEDLSIKERIILKRTFKNTNGSTDCIDLAQDTDRTRILVNAVMNFRVPKKGEIFLTSWGPNGISSRTLLRTTG